MENVLTQAKAAAKRKANNREVRTRNICSTCSARFRNRNALNAENSENVFTRPSAAVCLFFSRTSIF
jgi:hypothetical protein